MPNTSWSPRVLKDGSDSVGVLGALNRVYLNIGLYSEEWMKHFNPFFGGKRITPIEIETAESNSRLLAGDRGGTPNMAKFLHQGRAAGPVGGRARRKPAFDSRRRRAGRAARPCSPKPARVAIRANCLTKHARDDAGRLLGTRLPDLLEALLGYTKTDEFKAKMREIVADPDFLDGQLSIDRSAHPGDAAANQCLQPAGNQCHPRQHLGQFLFVDLQGLFPRSARSRCRIRSPRNAGNTRCPAADAASRGCLRWSASGRRRHSCSTTGSAHFPTIRRSKGA